MSNHETDAVFLQRALELAARGIGLTTPNPCVGAVVLDSNGEIAGEGFHTYEGVKHAEVLALEQAGARARGGTALAGRAAADTAVGTRRHPSPRTLARQGHRLDRRRNLRRQ